ncbi:hypothetical protein HUN08_02930 [Gordonia sp. X0973]|uniref:DUF6188 family protein n=1 Tax=Gordonia sp. X0973 TaxID=2742602 RepID=UPI000F540810|nr:DUF6188 family protein [Gordonia sp. X0973]QKT06265.1 hypothetical protein HUN08_02930 [Gordonia sp. X0973]
MKPLPLTGTITKVTPDFATYIFTDGGGDICIEAPMYVQEGDREYIIDPVEGHPDVELLNGLIGRTIVKMEYSFKDGLKFVTSDGARYHVPPIDYESWQVMGDGYYYVGLPSTVLDPPKEDD